MSTINDILNRTLERETFDSLVPITFYRYPSFVIRRLEDYVCVTDEDRIDYANVLDLFIKLFNKHSMFPIHRDNKIVFECRFKSNPIFFGFYNWRFSVGLDCCYSQHGGFKMDLKKLNNTDEMNKTSEMNKTLESRPDGLYLSINNVLHSLKIIMYAAELCRLVRYDVNHPTNAGELRKIHVIKLLRAMPNNTYGLKECKDLVEWVEEHKDVISQLQNI